MLARKLFRFAEFRGHERDAQTDLQRSEVVWEAVTGALSSLDAEMDGLGRRIEWLRGWVGGLMGTEDGAASPRGSSAEAELADAEQQLLSGLRRLAHLKELRVAYTGMQATIEAERARACKARLSDA